MAELGFIQKQIQLRQNLAGQNFTAPPIQGAKVYIMGQLVSGFDFQNDNIYVFMQTRISNQWIYNIQDYYDPRVTQTDQSDLINRTRSITQFVQAVPVGYQRRPVAHFSFPFAYNLLATQQGLLGRWPQMCLQVNSVDKWERHRILGYGFMEFPSVPGFHQLSVSTWRPIESLYSEVHSFYLGGSVRVQNPWELSTTFSLDQEGEESTLNRYGLHTQSSGSLKLRFSTVIQTQTELEQQREKAKSLNFKQKAELAWRRKEKKAATVMERTFNRFNPDRMQVNGRSGDVRSI